MDELTSDEEVVEAEEEHQPQVHSPLRSPPKKIHEFLILPQYDSDGDEIPDVDDINIDNKDNRANCISSDIDKVMESQLYMQLVWDIWSPYLQIIKVLEVYDEETCMEMMRSYYEVSNQTLERSCVCLR